MNDDWAVKEVVDQTTGRVHRLYTYKRRPCYRRVLSSRLVDQLAGYVLIEKDLRSVGTWLGEIATRAPEALDTTAASFRHGADREKYNLVKGLWVAALTFYGKCFSKCEGRPVKLERAQLDERFRDAHDHCMSYRHNFAAHSGAAKLEYVEIALVFPQKAKSHVEPRIYKELLQPDFALESSAEEPLFLL